MEPPIMKEIIMAKNITDMQRKNRFKSFDDMLAETTNETITIRVYGKDYTIPAQMPAIIPVMMARFEDDPEAMQRLTYLAGDHLFGHEAVTEWASHDGFTKEKLETIVSEVFKMIYGAPETETPKERIEDDVEQAADDPK